MFACLLSSPLFCVISDEVVVTYDVDNVFNECLVGMLTASNLRLLIRRVSNMNTFSVLNGRTAEEKRPKLFSSILLRKNLYRNVFKPIIC